jgi:hypothetical protein
VEAGGRIYVYKKTYYVPGDFDNNRYSPSFSPLIYPGQNVHGSAYLPDYAPACKVRLYARNCRNDEYICGEPVNMASGIWSELCLRLPALESALLDEVGFIFDVAGQNSETYDFCALIDDLYYEGRPNYTIKFSDENEEYWTSIDVDISQFTLLKGHMYLQDGYLNLSCGDFAEVYTGRHDWTDYSLLFVLKPIVGDEHFVNFRVQGAMRSYAAGFMGKRIVILKNVNGYSVLCGADFNWEYGQEYSLDISASGEEFTIFVDGKEMLCYRDTQKPYLNGAIGFSVRSGSHCQFRSIRIS